MTLIEQIDGAIGRLERGYLVKYSLSDGQGGYCMRGALWAESPDAVAEVKIAEAAGFQPEPYRYRDDFGSESVSVALAMANWNNRPERTKEEVIERLKRAKGVLQLEAEANKPQLEPVEV